MTTNFPLSPADKSTRVKGWILEYSIKQNLTEILKQFEHKNGRPATRGRIPLPNPVEDLPSSYLLLWFLHTTYNRLGDHIHVENVETLQCLLQVLQTLFKWSEVVPLKTFWSLHTKIKMMILVQSLRQKSVTPQLFNDYFPFWSPAYEDKLSMEYKIKNKSTLESIRKDHENCRMFLFSLMFGDGNINAYYKRFLVTEWKNYLANLKQLLASFVEAVVPMLPDNKVEEILEGNVSEESPDSHDPAFCILAKALKTCTAEMSSVEKALREALADLDSMTIDQSQSSSPEVPASHLRPTTPQNSTNRPPEKSPVCLTDAIPELPRSSSDTADKVQEVRAGSPIPEPEEVPKRSSQEDEPMPSTSTGITHESGKKRRMHALLQKKQRAKRRFFRNPSRCLFSSSEDDSS